MRALNFCSAAITYFFEIISTETERDSRRCPGYIFKTSRELPEQSDVK